MQKAIIKINKKVDFNNILKIHHAAVFDADDDDKVFFAFFDDAEVALYNQKSKFVAKMNTYDLDRLIGDGRVQIVP